MRKAQVRSLGQEDPLEEGMEPTSLFLPGEFQGQRSLASYSPQCCKESNMTEASEYTHGWQWGWWQMGCGSGKHRVFQSFVQSIREEEKLSFSYQNMGLRGQKEHSCTIGRPDICTRFACTGSQIQYKHLGSSLKMAIRRKYWKSDLSRGFRRAEVLDQPVMMSYPFSHPVSSELFYS